MSARTPDIASVRSPHTPDPDAGPDLTRFNGPRFLRWFALSCIGLLGMEALVEASGRHLAFSRSESAAPALYLVSPLTRPLRRGDYVSLPTPPNPYIDAQVIKRVRGVAGDRIERDGPIIRINGAEVARVKPQGRRGETLTPIAVGLIPDGYVYLSGTHRDSFDSRYAEFGLVPVDLIEGAADALF